MNEIKNIWRQHPIMCSFVLSFLFAFILGLISVCFIPNIHEQLSIFSDLVKIVFITGFCGVFILYPTMLTCINFLYLFFNLSYHMSRIFDLITIVLGSLYTFLLAAIDDIVFTADWMEVLYNREIHSPIWTDAYPTVLTFAIVGLIGYLLLAYTKLEKTPPLIMVIMMSMMYIGVLENILWIIQLGHFRYCLFILFPINCVIIAMKTIKYKIKEWIQLDDYQKCGFKNQFLNHCNQKLMNAYHWPMIAFITMLPILGIIICILLLWNQQPDYMFRSYLETSDWNLSQRVAPQNIYMDEHYLCTVAAGGHKNIVKPQRLGVRHGHQVIVNRQLCIANAFEQILEERIPHIHQKIRYIYDTYGFPITKCIHSAYIADIIYILMKPFEWVFLIVIYCCDTQPESRIARQYLPKIKEAK